jgi:MFS transporter, DHA1 family, inner membrane transport protein
MAPRRALDSRIWLLAIGTFAVGTDAFVVAGILPLLALSFGVSIEVAGLLVSTYSFTYGLGTPVLAAMVARWQRHRVVIVTLCGFALVNIGCALAPSFGVLLGLKVAAGICAATYTPTAYLLATSLTTVERRGAALAAVAIGLSAASVLGIPIGTWVGYRYGWHATFAMIAAITLTGAAALARGRLSDPAGGFAALPSLATRIAPLGRAHIWLALGPCFILYIATALVFTYVAALLRTHYSADQLPPLLAVYGLGGLLGSQLGGRLADRLGTARPLNIGLGGLIVIQLLLPWSLTSTVATCAALFGATLCSWCCFAPFQARILMLEPHSANVTIALINTSVYMGNAIGALIGGLLLRLTAVTNLPFVSALVAAMALAVLRWPLPKLDR